MWIALNEKRFVTSNCFKMVLKFLLSSFIICLLLDTLQASFSTDSIQLDEAASDLIISEDHRVFVAAANKLQVLGEDFSVEEVHTVAAEHNNISAFSLNLNGSRLVVCLHNGSCVSYDTTDFSVSKRYDQVSITTPPKKSVLAAVPSSLGDSFFIGSSGDNVILLGQYGFDDTDRIQRSSQWDFTISNESFYSRNFFAAFYFGNYSYFVVVDKTASASTSGVKILRVCNVPTESRFNALYEVGLQCGTSSADLAIVSVDTLVTTDGMSVVLGLTAAGHIRFCNISIADIDREVQTVFEDCIGGTEHMAPPWIQRSHADDCSQFTEQGMSECNFGSVNSVILIRVLAAQEKLELVPFFQHKTQLNVITAALSLVVDGVHLLLIGVSNDSGYFLAKYMADTGALIGVRPAPAAISILKWNHGDPYVVAATFNQVHKIPLESCSNITDCLSCSESADPLCGWCSLEGRCSRKPHCQHSTLHNRWIRESKQCVSEMVLFSESTHLSVDSLMNVSFSLLPESASLPQLTGNETLSCLFEGNTPEEHYSLTVPYNNGTCVVEELFPSFGDSSISLDLSLVYAVMGISIITSNAQITLHNCTMQEASSCSQCVASSSACGWCVYDHTCTGSSANCRDWTTLPANPSEENKASHFAKSFEECPAILQPDSGVYVHPVGVSQPLVVKTQNLPPPIPGYQYLCSVEYTRGRSVHLPVAYWNFTEVHCLTAAETLSSDGIEGVYLSLFWANTQGDKVFNIERISPTRGYQFDSNSNRVPPPPPLPPNMVLYNCSAFDGSCTSCIATTIDSPEVACGWCSGAESIGRCAAAGSCFDTSFARSATYCPSPTINSLSPSSGPIQGGTVVNITGTNLGVRVQDLKQILFGLTSCALDQSGYIPGTQVICTTSGSNSEGSTSVELQIQNGNRSWTIYSQFRYAIPSVDSVTPTYGPVSGGTLITISGNALNISSPQLATVIIAGAQCEIQSVTLSEIVCITSRASIVLSGFVVVQIDYSRTPGVEFTYTRDPEFTEVHPQRTILAGGVKLTFVGMYLNSSSNPIILFYLKNGSSIRKKCVPSNSTTLVCIAPELTGTYYDRAIDQSNATVNYTVVFGNAAGPSISEAALTLYVKPDPLFTQIHNDDWDYVTGSQQGIRILGRHLDNVLTAEIVVKIASDTCAITAVSPDILYCNPPDVLLSSRSGVEVTVDVANGTLTFNVGFLRYVMQSSNNGLLDVWMFVVIVVVGVLLLAVIMLIVVACILVAKRRTSEPQRCNSVLEMVPITDKEFLDQLSPINYYNQSAGGDDNFYEAIPDTHLQFDSDKLENPSTVTLNSTDNCYGDEERSNNTSSVATNRSRVLPPLPISEEYIEMGSHSVSSNNGSEDNETTGLGRFPDVAAADDKTSPLTTTAKPGVYVHMLHATDEQSSLSDSIVDSCHSSEQYVDMKQGSQLSMTHNQ